MTQLELNSEENNLQMTSLRNQQLSTVANDLREAQTKKFDALNRLIEVLDGALPLVTRTPRTAARYEIKRSTYLRLCEELGVEVKDDPGD